MKSTNFYFGLLLVFVATLGFFTIGDTKVGTLSNVGGAFFPYVISFLLGSIGGIFIINAFFTSEKENKNKLNTTSLLSLITIFASSLFFAFTLQYLGLILSVSISLLIASILNFKGLANIGVIALLTFLAVIIFFYTLNLDIALLP